MNEVEIGFAIGTIQADDQVEGKMGVSYLDEIFQILLALSSRMGINGNPG